MPEDTVFTVLEICVRQDSSGMFHIDSKDVPGLFLSGVHLEKLCAQVEPAIKLLYKLNKGVDVILRPVSGSAEFPIRCVPTSAYGECPTRYVAYA